MANFGRYFLSGFGNTFPSSFDTSFRYGLQKQEDEEIKRKQAEYQKNQQDILGQLVTNLTLDPSGIIRPLTQQEKEMGYLKLSPQNQNAFEYIQKLREPDYSTPTMGKNDENLLAWDKKSNKIVNLGKNPYYVPPKKEKLQGAWIEESKETRTEYKGYEITEDEARKEGDSPFIKNVKGKWMFITDVNVTNKPQKSSGDGGSKLGEEYWGEGFTKEIQKRINKLYESSDIKVATEKGDFVYQDPITGTSIKINQAIAGSMYGSAKNQLNNFILTQLGEDDDFNNLVSAIEFQSPGQVEPSVWKTIKENYTRGGIDKKTFQEWTWRYIAKYGFNPISRFGNGQ